eukprot:UN22473
MILFESRLNEFSLQRSLSRGNGTVTDRLHWLSRSTGTKSVWKRYTAVMCLDDLFYERCGYHPLDNLCLRTIQEFLGHKVSLGKRLRQKRSKRKKVTYLFSTHREQQVSVLLRYLKLYNADDYKRFRNTVWMFDESKKGLPDDMIVQVRSIFPTAEEVNITTTTPPSQNPTETENFFRSISKIPNLIRRVDDWAFKVEFQDRVQLLTNQLKVLKDASDFFFNDKKLKQLFGMVLTIANFLKKNKRKTIYGFSLESLRNLNKDVYFYLATELVNNHRGLLEFTKDVDKVIPPAMKMSYKEVEDQFQELGRDVSNMEARIDNYTTLSGSDSFVKTFSGFIEKARIMYEKTNSSFVAVQNSIIRLQRELRAKELFNFRSNRQIEGFAILYNFKEELVKAIKEIDKGIKIQTAKLRVQKQREERKKRMKAKKKEQEQKKEKI